MMSKRMPLALTLGALLFVTAGFGATKKFHRNDGSRHWNDLSLQNGHLLDARSSLSRGVWLPIERCVEDFRLVSHPWHPQHP